jgi:SAM-dependent methyltransferase
MGGRLLAAAVGNLFLVLAERILPGRERECLVCNWQGRRFRTFLSADEIIADCICPECGSFDRHRQLVLGVRAELAARPGWSPEVMLGLSLSTAMRFVMEHEGLGRCFRSDITAEDHRFAPDLVTDLRQPGIGEATVDWIFCSHVLEHINELDTCVDELLRILRPGGIAWLQVPFEPGLAHSHRIAVDPHRAHAHAWQFAPDFGRLIERSGWTIAEVIAGETVPEPDRRRYGIHPLERYWLARKDA